MVSALLVSIAALTTAGRHSDLQDLGEPPFAKKGEVAFRLSAVDQGQKYRVFVYYANEAKGSVKILEPMRNRCYFEYEERWKDAAGA